MSKAKELLESLKSLPKEMLPEEPAIPSFDDKEIEGVELTEEEDKEYHTKKEGNETKVFHKDNHIGSVKEHENGSAMMWMKKDGKMKGGHMAKDKDHAVSVIKRLHKEGKMMG